MSFSEGDVVDVYGFGGKRLYQGEVTEVAGETAYVVRLPRRGKSKPVHSSKLRRLERAAPKASKLTRKPDTSQPPPAPIQKRRRPARDQAYLKHVRSFSCCACGVDAPIEAHHWDEHGGMSQKPSDYFTVPLCKGCHDTFHDTGRVRVRRAGAWEFLDPDETKRFFKDEQRRLMERAMSNALHNRRRR